MRLAIPTWDDRVSPVLDVAKRLLVVNVDDGRELSRSEADIEGRLLVDKVRRIKGLGIDVLVCGAISRPMETLLRSAGLRVIPHTCGAVEDVLQAFLAGELPGDAFLMPGCCARRRRLRRACGRRGGRGCE